jgi:isocitrate dehydrogenase
MSYTNVTVPTGGAKISIENGKLNVPNNPIIPYVEGDGTGRDIWRASERVFEDPLDGSVRGREVVQDVPELAAR